MSSKLTFVLSLLSVGLLSTIEVWPIHDSSDTKAVLVFFIPIASYFIGLSQGTYSKYLADSWTDRRRDKESKAKRSDVVEEAMNKTQPVVESFRSAIKKDSSKLVRDFKYSSVDVHMHGSFIKIVEEENFSTHRLMIERLENVNLLSIEANETCFIGGKLSEELYKILQKDIE